MDNLVSRRELAEVLTEIATQINAISARLAGPADLEEDAVSGDADASTWTLVTRRTDVDYRWMDGAVDVFETFDVYEHPESKRQWAIGRVAPREISGRGVRAYSVPFTLLGGEIEYPIGTFYDTDDHDETGDLACVIRGAGETKRGMYGPGDSLPDDYRRFPTAIHRDRINRGGGRTYNRVVVIAPGGDHTTMLDYARVAARLRFGME